jgi:hypothetical protein
MSEIVKSIKLGELNENFNLDAFDSKQIYMNVHEVVSIEQKTNTLSSGMKVKIYRFHLKDGSVVEIAAFKEL